MFSATAVVGNIGMKHKGAQQVDDKEFEALQLRASLCPHREEWPDEHIHWQLLGGCIDDLRKRVSTVHNLMSAVDRDINLSSEGRRNQKAKFAQEAIADLKATDSSLAKARESVSSMQARWQQKVDEILKQPADAAEATLHWEIRDKFCGLEDERARMRFLESFGGDAQIASALLGGPVGLTNLSDAERALLQRSVEGQVDTAIIAARNATAKAMTQAEEAWIRAENLIARRGGLQKSFGGSWSDAA